MSSDCGESKKDKPVEEQRGQKRKNSERDSNRGSESAKRIRKILRDLSYYDSDGLSTNSSDTPKPDEDQNSDTSSVVFVAQLREPDPTEGPSNALGTKNSDEAVTLSSHVDVTPPERDVNILSLATQKVNEWLIKGQKMMREGQSSDPDAFVNKECDFDDLSESMFEWLLKVAEDQETKKLEKKNAKSGEKKSAEGTDGQNENDDTAQSCDSLVSRVEIHMLPTHADLSPPPAREMYIDPDIIEISDDEEAPPKALPDDSKDEVPDGSEHEETETHSETDSKETNTNGTQTPMATTSESSQDTNAETGKETDGTTEHDTQDHSEDENEQAEDDGQNVESNLDVPEMECSADSALNGQCPNLIEWLIKD